MTENSSNEKKSVFSAGGTDDEKKNRFQAGGIISMAAMLAGGIFQVAWMNTTNNMLGARDMGLYGPLVSLFYMLTNIAALGIPQTVCTFVSHHYETQIDESKKFMADGIRLLLIISVLMLVITTSAALILGLTGITSWLNSILAIVLALSVSVTMLFWGINSILMGFQRLDLAALGNMIFPIGIFGGAVVFIIMGQSIAGKASQWDVVGGVGGMFVGNLMAFLIAVFAITRLKLIKVSDVFNFKQGNGLYGKILKFGGLAAVAMIFISIIQQMPPVVLRWFTPAFAKMAGMSPYVFGDTAESFEKAVGYFSTALLYGMATMLVSGLALAILPAFSEAESQGRKDLMQHYFTSALSQAFVILIAFIAVYAVQIGDIVRLISGPDFSKEIMHTPTVLSVIGGAGASLLFVVIHIYFGMKRPAVAAIVLGFVLVVLTVGTVACSLIFKDINWAFGGLIISTWGGVIVFLILAKTMFGLSTPTWIYLEPVLACLPGLAIVHFMPRTPVFAGINIAIILIPYGLIIWLRNKQRKKSDAPVNP